MEILVFNNTDIKDIEVGTWIDELFEKYMEICGKRILYQVNFAGKSLKDWVNETNKGCNRLIDSVLMDLCEPKTKEFLGYEDSYDYSDMKIVILMESAKTLHLWGEANNFIAILKHISKSNLWHEISHLFSVEDHYTRSGIGKSYCKDENCLMAYGNETEVFCEYAKEEIRKYFRENGDK